MVSPIRHKVETTPTGRQRVRRGWFGKMILQVEMNYDSRCGLKTDFNVGTFWRDATEDDLRPKYVVLMPPPKTL